MSRIVAAVVAVLLVVVALVVRNRLDEEERLGPYKLACGAALATACESLGDVEVTADSDEADGSLRIGRSTDTDQTLAHTKVAVAIWKDRAAALRQGCKEITWTCIGDAAAKGWAASGGDVGWGQVKLAFGDPATDDGGLAALAAASIGVTTDPDLVPAALDENDAYLRWLTAVSRARVSPGLASMLASGPAVADAYLGLDAEINSVLPGAARRDDVEVVYLSPVIDVGATFVNNTSRRVPSGLREALIAHGWKPVAEAGALQLPSANALEGLRNRWKEVQ